MPSKKALRIVGYVVFGLGAFLFSLYLTFPAEAVGQRLGHELTRATQGAVTVTFADVSLYRLSGIEAEGVKVRWVRKRGDPIEFEVDELNARVQLLQLLLLNLDVSVGVEAGGGEMQIDVDSGRDAYDVEARFDEVDLGSPPLLGVLVGMPVRGKISGSLKATLGHTPKTPDAPGALVPDTSDGQASFTIHDASLGPATIQGFTVPAPLSLGQLDVGLDMRKGRARLASFQQKGGQVALHLAGSLTLRPEVGTSNLETCLQFKVVDDEYLKKFPTISSALELAQVQLGRDGENFLHVKHGGTLSSPRREPGLCRGTGQN